MADVRTAILRADDARVTTAEQRRVIENALAHPMPDVRMAALRAIGRTQRAEFLPKAIAELANPSIDVRREAAFAVAHIGSGESTAFVPAEKALLDALGRETDILVCAALAEEYGRLPFLSSADVDGAAQTIAGLLSRLGRDGGVAPIVELGAARGAEALARRAARLEADRNRASGFGTRDSETGMGGAAARSALPARHGALAALLGSFYNAQRVAADRPQDIVRARTRRLAVMGMLSLDRMSADLVTLAVADTDAQVRRLGVMAQAKQSIGPAVPVRPTGWLGDAAVIVRHAVASRIGAKRPDVAEAALADAHVNVRLAALDALGEAGACRAACASRLDRPEAFAPAAWHEGAHALVALARTDAAAVQSHVARASGADTWQVRMYAARAAGYSRQADVLARLAADDNVNVRHAALASWRGARLPGLTAAAVAALASDDGQLVIEAVAALGPGSGDRGPGTGSGASGVAAGQPPVAAGLVPRADIVAALRAALARLTAQGRETSRDPRVALIERIDEIDPARAETLRPYLSDFDPFVAARVAAIVAVDTDRPQGGPAAVGSPLVRRSLGEGGSGPSSTGGDGRLGEPALPAIQPALPTMMDVERLAATTVTLRFSGGRSLTLRLYAELAPTAVARFVTQVRAGEWNGRTFHRVEPGFVVQGGSPAANEYAGAATTFTRDEFSSLSHVRGTVGISTRGPDTGDGQIFINLVDNARLDFAYTIIGSIVGDASTIDDIVEGEVIEAATVSTLVATAGQSPAATPGAP